MDFKLDYNETAPLESVSMNPPRDLYSTDVQVPAPRLPGCRSLRLADRHNRCLAGSR